MPRKPVKITKTAGVLTIEGVDNDGKPASDYLAKIEAMNDEDLSKEGESKIWLSAYANNNSKSDYHWQCDAVYDVMRIRDPSGTMYQEAFDAAKKSAGH